jgi:anthranilate synthase component 2
MSPEKIIISAGSGRAVDAGICIEIVKNFFESFPILGINLGLHAIYEAFGGKISFAAKQMHGRASEISVNSRCEIFADLPPFIQVGQYHSLLCEKKSLPDALEIIAHADDEIMAVRHKNFPVYGLQFHLESILTPKGQKIMENFICRK